MLSLSFLVSPVASSVAWISTHRRKIIPCVQSLTRRVYRNTVLSLFGYSSGQKNNPSDVSSDYSWCSRLYFCVLLNKQRHIYLSANVDIDGDSPGHLEWIYNHSCQRAKEFGIQGVNMRLVKGVVKRIIPAVASTNAVIASAIVTEVSYFFIST